MKNYLNSLILILGLFMIGTVNAQTGGINGTIVDETGTSIPGASIMIQGTSNGVVSDIDGNFLINQLDDGNYTIVVSYIGYVTQNLAIQVPQDQNLSIILMEDTMLLEDVIVTGVFDARTKMEASVAITTIGVEQLERVAPTSSADLLKNIPGVYVNQSRGEIWNSVYSRGLSAGSIDNLNGYRYVSLQEDGLPVTNVELYPDLFLRADAMTKRVEAVRGGTASILGANAPGGIFNYVSKTGGDKFAGEVRAKYGLEGNGKNPYYRADFNFGGPLSKGW
ncbi:MAG: carboxypeptidase-like regulatory domain-containing protein, partial [Wenyingzhuangia sp.]|uniref:TonB-dependent receptor plug domain-containing protein n=1 Tax=Wenyingzhuangia sp. TaxID=1964193 RepID=UPI003219A6F4